MLSRESVVFPVCAEVEAQTEMLSDSLETTLATKSDIFDLKTDLAVVKWMLGILLAGVLAILLKAYFPH